MATFRTDPRTGRATISSDNMVRSDGYTDRERAQISITPEDPRRQNQRVTPEGAGTFQDFLAATGRSNTNPYGDAGLFGARANFSNSMTPRQIEDVNRLAYNQYLGLVSGRGTQRGGIGDFIPGYAPALKLGSNTPRGRVIAAPTQPKQGGIFSLSPMIGILRNLFGGGNTLRALNDGGVDYSTEGIETLNEVLPSLEKPVPGYDTLSGDPQPSGFMLTSNESNNIFNLPLNLQNVPKTGIGRFVEENKDGLQFGPGKIMPEFDEKNQRFGLTYKVAI